MRATATRDLQDLIEKGALTRTGRAAPYAVSPEHCGCDAKSVAHLARGYNSGDIELLILVRVGRGDQNSCCCAVGTLE
jgi:hypothetical protein